jgi:hypothetical protein
MTAIAESEIQDTGFFASSGKRRFNRLCDAENKHRFVFRRYFPK